MLRWKFEDSLPLLVHFQNGCPEETKNRNLCISISNYHIYTQLISRYIFQRMTNTVILVKNLYISLLMGQYWPFSVNKNYYYSKRTSKSMIVTNYGQKIVISMKSTNMPWKIRDTWPPWGFKDVDHGKKQKAKINHFRKTAFIYHRFISFNSK